MYKLRRTVLGGLNGAKSYNNSAIVTTIVTTECICLVKLRNEGSTSALSTSDAALG